jgi:hypothetical protein
MTRLREADATDAVLEGPPAASYPGDLAGLRDEDVLAHL